METSGAGPYAVLKEAAKFLKVLLYDVKVLDREKHLAGTGQSNEMILDNLKRLTVDLPDLPIIVRTPVIPGFNDSLKDAEDLGQFLETLPKVAFEPLPYHRFGEGKYAFLGRDIPLPNLSLEKGAFENFKRLTRSSS
jgi:pyruvate formate lyase activating enzyme